MCSTRIFFEAMDGSPSTLTVISSFGSDLAKVNCHRLLIPIKLNAGQGVIVVETQQSHRDSRATLRLIECSLTIDESPEAHSFDGEPVNIVDVLQSVESAVSKQTNWHAGVALIVLNFAEALEGLVRAMYFGTDDTEVDDRTAFDRSEDTKFMATLQFQFNQRLKQLETQQVGAV